MATPEPPSPSLPAGQTLTATEREVVVELVAAAALGAGERVRASAQQARRLGVSTAQLREALLLVVPYAGFPRALAAFAWAEAPPGDGARPDEEVAASEHARAGRRAFEAVYGPTAARVLGGLAALDPLLPAWTLEFAYGRVIARGVLALRDRELLAVALLAALGGLPDPLLGHMRGALRLGASGAEVAHVLDALPPEVGAGPRSEARSLLGRLSA